MSYKNIEDKKECWKRWYRRNRIKVIEKNKIRKYKIREENYKWFREYKQSLSCEICGENHIACIDFHHKFKRKNKRELINYRIKWGCSRKTILNEIEKCRVLCSNCHRKLHYDERKTI